MKKLLTCEWRHTLGACGALKNILLLATMLISLPGQAAAGPGGIEDVNGGEGDPEQPGKASYPLFAICMHQFLPHEALAELETFAEWTQARTDLYWKYKKAIERRFSEAVHLPLEKGTVGLIGPAGTPRLDFDVVYSEEEARQVIAEFSSQWISPAPRKQPLYEVELLEPAAGRWTLIVHSLYWKPIFPADPLQEIKYQKVREPHLTYYFRHAGTRLWSSRDQALLETARLDLIPEDLSALLAEDGTPRRRLVTFWMRPENVPEQLRSLLVSAMLPQLANALQPRDGETEGLNLARTQLALLRMMLVRGLLLDLEEAFLTIDQHEQSVSVQVRLRVQKDSGSHQLINAMQTTASVPPVDSVGDAGLSVAAEFRVPQLAFAENDGSIVLPTGGATVAMQANIQLPPDREPQGYVHIRSETTEKTAVGDFIQPVEDLLRAAVQRLANQKQLLEEVQVRQDDLGTWFLIGIAHPSNGDDLPSLMSLENPLVRKHAMLSIRVDDQLLVNARQRMVDLQPHEQLSQSERAGDPGAECLKLDMRFEGQHGHLRLSGSRFAIYQLMAIAFHEGFRL